MRASDARVPVKIAHSDHYGGVRYLFGLNTDANPLRLLVTCECGEGLRKVALARDISPNLERHCPFDGLNGGLVK
jgi:hypothetical protein